MLFLYFDGQFVSKQPFPQQTHWMSPPGEAPACGNSGLMMNLHHSTLRSTCCGAWLAWEALLAPCSCSIPHFKSGVVSIAFGKHTIYTVDKAGFTMLVAKTACIFEAVTLPAVIHTMQRIYAAALCMPQLFCDICNVLQCLSAGGGRTVHFHHILGHKGTVEETCGIRDGCTGSLYEWQ